MELANSRSPSPNTAKYLRKASVSASSTELATSLDSLSKANSRNPSPNSAKYLRKYLRSPSPTTPHSVPMSDEEFVKGCSLLRACAENKIDA